MFHLTVAIARFFEILLWDIARSIAGLIAAGVIGVVGFGAAAVAIWKLARKYTSR